MICPELTESSAQKGDSNTPALEQNDTIKNDVEMFLKIGVGVEPQQERMQKAIFHSRAKWTRKWTKLEIQKGQ